MFRRYRGWATALHGGANATRVDFCDWDGLTARQAGVNASDFGKLPWANGIPWENGNSWQVTPPCVPVASPTGVDTSIIHLGDLHWGHRLGEGDLVGFYPFHMGLYMVTEIIEPGTYRIWPPLRKAVAANDSATLRPALAMRLESEDAANAPRATAFAEGLSVTMVEVPDYDVREYFAD